MKVAVTKEIPLQDLPDLLGKFGEVEVEELGWATVHRASDENGTTIAVTSPHSDTALVLA